jgi:hypothetical protein
MTQFNYFIGAARDLDNMILDRLIAILGIRKHYPNEHTDEFQQFRRRFQLPISLGGALHVCQGTRKAAFFVGSFALAAHPIALVAPGICQPEVLPH